VSDLIKNFADHFEDTYNGALICPMSSELWVPGMLLNVRWWRMFRSTEIVSVEGHVADMDLFDGELSRENWPTVEAEAQMAELSFVSKASLSVSDVMIPQIGLELDADYARESKISVTVEAVTTKTFEDTFAHRKIREKLVSLRANNRSWYDMIHGDMLITQSHYISGFQMTVMNKNNVTLAAGINQGLVQFRPGIDYNKENEHTYTVGGSTDAPVAVNGIRIDYSRPDFRG